MTCIVAMKKQGIIYLGGDSLATSGNEIVHMYSPKVYEKEGMVFGSSGPVQLRNILQQTFKIPNYTGGDLMGYMVNDFIDGLRQCFKEKGFATLKDGNEEFDGSFIVGFQGEIFLISHDYCVIQSGIDYAAIGAGSEYAYGSMHTSMKMGLAPSMCLENALEAAVSNCTHVRGPFSFVRSQEAER